MNRSHVSKRFLKMTQEMPGAFWYKGNDQIRNGLQGMEIGRLLFFEYRSRLISCSYRSNHKPQK